VAQIFAPIVANNGAEASFEQVVKVCGLMKDRVNFVHEMWDLCSFFFFAPQTYDEKTVRKRWKEDSPRVMAELSEVLQSVSDFSVEGQEAVVMPWIESKGYKLGDVMNAFRLCLVGEGKGPGMFDISAFLGKEETIHRIDKAIATLNY
jgi:glutamyl-tRNA synthetase